MRTEGRTVGGGGGEGDVLGPSPADVPAPLIEAGVSLAAELSLQVLLRRLVEIAVQITRARYGALGVMGPQGEISEFITVGLSDEERDAIGSIPSGRGILGALIHDPQPLRLTRIQDDPRSVGFPPHHPPMTTFLGAPVRAQGQVFGNLYLTEKEGGQTFSAADQDAVVTLATQAGVAIANAQIYRELQQQGRWLGALHEITAALLAGAPQPRVLTTIVRSARKLIGADLAAIALPVDVGSTALRIVAADGLGSDRLMSAPGRPSGTASHSVLSTGRPLLARLASVDFQSHLVSDAVPVEVLMVVPLLLRERVNGTIILTRSASDADFNSNDLSLLESFASQAALTLDYDRFQAQARALAVMEERRRIARDLHDEPVQALIYLAQRLEAMAVESSTSVTSPTKLKETRELAVAVVDGLRQLTEGLRSEILDIEGLAAALKDLTRRFTLRTAIPARFAIRGTPARWDPELERNLFRLAQEALSNIERHAEARKVRLDLLLRPGGVTLRVADDGVGFVTSGQGAISPGLGTIGMQERAALHGGRLLIRSRPGRGTVLLATMPVTHGSDGGDNHPWAQE